MSNISSYANRREDLFFRREQSRETRSASWETRLPPIRSPIKRALNAFGWIGFFGTVFALCFFR